MYEIFKFNELDCTKIKFDNPIDSSLLTPKEYKKGFSIMYVNYNNNPLLIELPSLLLKSYMMAPRSLIFLELRIFESPPAINSGL